MTTTTAPPRPATERKAAKASTYRSQATAGYLFVTPFLVVFALFFLLPLAYAAYLSLFREQLIGGTVFAGLDNYVRALGDERLLSGVFRVARFFVLQVPIMLLLALLAALAIDSGLLRASKVFRVGIFIPYAVPSVVATLMWGYLYGRDFGPFAQLGHAIGAATPDFLSDGLMLGSMANIVTWEFTGYNMIIFYSALQSIPQEIYESGRLDGLSETGIALRLKLPLIVPALILGVLFSIVGALQLFNEPIILKNLTGSAITTSYTPNIFAFNVAVVNTDFNYGGAIAVILGVITFAFSFGFLRLTRGRLGV